MSGTDRLIELAKGAMHAAATIHAETERLRYEAWRRGPAKGKPKYEPDYDRAQLCATFEDLFRSSVDALKEASNDTPN